MAEEELKDDLTGFYLRKALFSSLADLIKSAALPKKSFSLLILDLDHFKRFNDKFGHPAGDEILKYFTSTLTLSSVEKKCDFYRYGGDEIVIVLPESNAKEALKLANHFKYNMTHHSFIFRGRVMKITASVGIASFPVDGVAMEDLINRADEALYFSKRHGRNSITLAGRIKYLKILNAIRIVCAYCVIIAVSIISYEFFLKEPILNGIETIKSFRFFTAPLDTDRITLKDGTVITGKISEETNLGLIVNKYEDGITTVVNLKKSEIDQIQYGSKSPSKQRYLEYIKTNPNPHLDKVVN